MFDRLRRALAQWAQGSPPMNEKVYKTIYRDFSVIMYLSGLFLNMRAKYWVVSVTYAFSAYAILSIYIGIGLKTLALQIHDYSRAAETGLLILIMLNVVLEIVFLNVRRSDFIGLFRSMTDNYYDYGDSEEIREMEVEFRKSRKQKIFVLVVCPVYLAITAVIAISGRSMDLYVGAVSDTAYENGVYVLTPRPAWYPFPITNDVTHYFVVFTQVCAAGAVAAYYAGYLAMVVGFSQSLALQFKILKYRLRKLTQLAYKLHLKRMAADSPNPLDAPLGIFNDPHFLECYNTYLNKCAAHHTILVRNFIHFRRIHEWPCYIGMILVTIMTALSLLVLILEKTRPSIILFGFLCFVICLINLGIMCWQTEYVIEISEDISHELYDTNWIDVDQRAKRTMMIMYERIKKSLALRSAVSRTSLTWETYSSMLNTAYSYVNVLRATRVNK